MAEITLKNAAGSDAGTVDLDDVTFGIEPNVSVLHQVVTAQLAARRAGTQSTKTRSEVRGGGAKPYRQKGTGNARQGSIRSPQFSGGGVALGPKPRSYSQKTPKKMVKLALRSALSDRASEGKVVVVDEWSFGDTPSTKAAKQALAGLGVEGKALVVVGRDNAAAALSFRNLPDVQLIAPAELNAYDVLCNDYIVFTQDVLPTSIVDATSATAPAETKSDVTDAVATDTEAPYGEGSHGPLADDAQPDGYPIKGNADSMLFHTPESPSYAQTVAEVWFADEATAEAAGFAKPASQQSAAETTEPAGDATAAAESKPEASTDAAANEES